MKWISVWLAVFSLFAPVSASAVLDPDASVVLARSRPDALAPDPCTGLDNCFTWTVSTATWSPQDLWAPVATAWIWQTRTPSASKPLLVDVGPGEFGRFACNGGGHVTLRGSGREQTILRSTTEAIKATNCQDLSFIDLGAHGDKIGALWLEGGFSTWVNTDLVATGTTGTIPIAGWGDICLVTPAVRSTHYFHSSRIRTTGYGNPITAAFYSQCADNWIFGGEILLDLDGPFLGNTPHSAVRVVNLGHARIFGSAIRAHVGPNASGPGLATYGVNGLFEQFAGEPPLHGGIHVHGSIVNVSAAEATVPVRVTGIERTGTGDLHTPETAFNLSPSPSGGSVERISTYSVYTRSPYLWEHGTTPPVATTETNVLISQHGADMYVETDCASDGDCEAPGNGNEPHLMVYAVDACPTEIWLDSVTGRCRGDTTP